MPKSKLEDLLPLGSISSKSRSEVLQQLAVESAGPANVTGAGSTGTNIISDAFAGPLKDTTEQLSALTQQVSGLASAQQTQIGVTQDNTQAVTQNTSAHGTGGSSVANTVSGIASDLLGGGFGLSPIVTGLMSLFGGGGSEVSTPVTPFKLPTPVQYEAGLSGSGTGQIVPVDYGQSGQVRPQSSGPTSQVTIQVNAMDSRSFLDHSEEIAQAVKQAMLNSSSLNDVIADL